MKKLVLVSKQNEAALAAKGGAGQCDTTSVSLVFTNSQGIIPSQFIGQTTDSWGNGGIYFGFNISRNFSLARPPRKQPAY